MTSTIDIRPLQVTDGHRWELQVVQPAEMRAALLWLPALGVAARHYLPLARALAQAGVATFLHEWRGLGSSNLRASRYQDWGYRELLTLDLAASQRALDDHIAATTGTGRRPMAIIGGHSLGGQLACCHAALAAAGNGATPWQRLWLVAAGTPHWRSFPRPQRWALPVLYAGLRWLARWHGYLPGRRLGFGGNEARGLIADWSRVGGSGRYRATGLEVDLDAALAQLRIAVDAVVMARDWMAPASSLAGLLARLGTESARTVTLDAGQLGTAADHFAWMQQPDAVVAALLANPAAAD